MIGTGTADGTGAFTVTIPAGEAGANETLTAVAKTPAAQKYANNVPNTSG